MKILTIDDSKTTRMMIRYVIEHVGYEAIEAENGDEGLAALARHGDEVALVLLDWHMPGRNGLECLQVIRQNPDTCTIPVLMLTAETHRESVIAAVRLGASNYLTKPFTPELLATKITQCLGLAHDPS